MPIYMRIARLIGMLIFSASAALADERQQNLTADDILKMEDIGRVAITADGRFLVYEWMAPYETSPNLHAYYPRDTSPLAKLRVVDIATSNASRPLFEQEDRGGYWLGAPSPAGSRLAIYSLVADQVKAGVYDFASRRATWFDFTPNYATELSQRPVWISEDELIYAAMPPGEQPGILYGAGFAARINALWSKFRDGRESSATVLTSRPEGVDPVSGADPSRIFRPGRLMRANARTGAAQILDEGYFYNTQLSPDRRYLAALREGGERAPEPDEPLTQLNRRWRQLVLHDLVGQAGRIVPCETCDVVRGSVQWSADGRRLVFLARETDPNVSGRAPIALFQYRLDASRLERIAAPGLRLSCQGLRLAPLGSERGVAIFVRPLASDEAPRFALDMCENQGRYDWFLLKESQAPANLTASFAGGARVVGLGSDLFVSADGDVWRLDASGARSRATTNLNLPSHVSVYEPHAFGVSFPTAFFLGRSIPTSDSLIETDDKLINLNLETGAIGVLEKPSADSALAAADGARLGAFVKHSGNALQLLLARERGRVEQILSVNEHLNEIAVRDPIQIDYDYRDRRMSSCAVVPPDWRRGRRYPMIVYAYPETPSGACGNTSLSAFDPYNVQLLAAHGYVVLFAANPRELTQTADGPTRGLTPVVLAAVDAAIREGIADPNRLGVFGFSQGFHSVLQLITETNRFKAAVASHGFSEAASNYGSMALANRMDPDSRTIGGMLRYELAQSANYLGLRPWEDPQRYVLNSPLFEAEKIETPLMLMHSDFDSFALGQSEEMFTALYRLRKEAVYVTYWGEGHGNRSPANIRDMWRRMFDWYDEHLGAPSAQTRSREPSRSRR